MLRIRLQRVGRKHETAFRVVVVDSRRGPKSGRALEVLGSYNPDRGKPILKNERIKYWLSVGTQVSGTVHNLLVDAKIITRAKINILPKRRQPKVEVVVEARQSTPVVVTAVASNEIPAPAEPKTVVTKVPVASF